VKTKGLWVTIERADDLHKILVSQSYQERVKYKERTGIEDIFGFNGSFLLKFRDDDHLLSFILTIC